MNLAKAMNTVRENFRMLSLEQKIAIDQTRVVEKIGEIARLGGRTIFIYANCQTPINDNGIRLSSVNTWNGVREYLENEGFIIIDNSDYINPFIFEVTWG